MKKRQGKVSDETVEYTETHRAMLKICEEFYNGSDCDRGLKTTLQELPKQISSKTDFFHTSRLRKYAFQSNRHGRVITVDRLYLSSKLPMIMWIKYCP
jgi:hypothetical protein